MDLWLHLLMVIKLGINEWPMRAASSRKQPRTRLHELTQKDGAPFVPMRFWKDLFFRRICHLGGCRVRRVLRPLRTSGQPDPTIIQTAQDPITSSCGLYAVLSFLPPSMETPALLIARSSCSGVASSPISVRRGRKSWRGARLLFSRSCLSPFTCDLHPSRGVYFPMEPGDERVEQ